MIVLKEVFFFYCLIVNQNLQALLLVICNKNTFTYLL